MYFSLKGPVWETWLQNKTDPLDTELFISLTIFEGPVFPAFEQREKKKPME